LSLGGESRLARMARAETDALSALTPPRAARRIKWTLVTPACFENGWRPNWIAAETGQVMLRSASPGDAARRSGEDRRAWRERIRGLSPIAARLVGVCCPKPLAHSGWAMLGEGAPGPKPTRLLVPAGAVYYFAADTDAAAADLVLALHGRTLSDRYGETGMGLGFCGTWTTEDGKRKMEDRNERKEDPR
jgi:CRISPR-associated protein Cmr3